MNLLLYFLQKESAHMSLKKFAAAVAMLMTFSATAFAETADQPSVYAQAAYVLDADTGNELYARNPDQRMYPGSTTKIMTGILGIELGKAQGILDQPINITQDSLNLESDASVLGLYPGDQVTLRHALTGMLIVSGCDAAVDVAETVTPSEAAFVQKMNEKAAALGATNTHFVNPHGLPDTNHYTTARDLAHIAAYGMTLSEFRDMVGRSEYDMPYINGGTKHCTTTNYFLTSGFPGANGIKTGTTNAGGPCLVTSATQDGRTVIAVILNSQDRFGDAQTLMKYGFDTLKPLENVYIMRTAPAGQTLSQVAAQKQQAPAAADTAATTAQKAEPAPAAAYGTDMDTVPEKNAKSA